MAALAPEVRRGLSATWPEAPTEVTVGYDPPWRRVGLAAALAEVRLEEVRRQVCLVGPHRDDLDL